MQKVFIGCTCHDPKLQVDHIKHWRCFWPWHSNWTEIWTLKRWGWIAKFGLESRLGQEIRVAFFLIEKSINSRSDGFLDLEKPVMGPTFTWDPHHLRSFRLCCLCLCSDLIMYTASPKQALCKLWKPKNVKNIKTQAHRRTTPPRKIWLGSWKVIVIWRDREPGSSNV